MHFSVENFISSEGIIFAVARSKTYQLPIANSFMTFDL
jgi:hypothetical protein